jgi:hypothetical protein
MPAKAQRNKIFKVLKEKNVGRPLMHENTSYKAK